MDILGLAGLLLSSPFGLAALGLFFIGMWYGLMRIKYSNDPYFPFKKHKKVTVILKTTVPGKSAVIDGIDRGGKIGDKGLYIPSLNKVYSNVVHVVPGNPAIVTFVRGVDGGYYPGMTTFVTTDNLTDIDKVAERELGVSKEEAKEIKKTFLVDILPTINNYRGMMTAHIRDFTGLITDNMLKEEKQGVFKLIDNPNFLMIAIALIGIGFVYLAFSDASVSLSNKYDKLMSLQQQIQEQQNQLYMWCIKSVKTGNIEPLENYYKNSANTTNSEKSDNILNILG